MPPFAATKKNYAYQPPVFYCGYPSNSDDLLSYAEKHNLVQYYPEDEEPESEDDDNVDFMETAEVAFEHITTNAGITSFKLRLVPILPLPVPGGKPDDEYATVISIFSNYVRIGGEKEYPTGADIKKLQDFMKMHLKNTPSDRPRWYLSCYFGTWAMRNPTL